MRCIFYFRQGCHLCEEMASVLYQRWPGYFESMQWMDIDTRADLKARFDTLVPVLEVDGVVASQHFPDIEKLTRCFGEPSKKVL